MTHSDSLSTPLYRLSEMFSQSEREQTPLNMVKKRLKLGKKIKLSLLSVTRDTQTKKVNVIQNNQLTNLDEYQLTDILIQKSVRLLLEHCPKAVLDTGFKSSP